MIAVQYHGPYKPFNHQKVTTEFIIKNSRCFVLNDMGTGKTASTVWAIRYLFSTNEIKRVLIVSPLSTLIVVWQKEFQQLYKDCKIVVFTRNNRDKQIIASDWQVGIVNYDGLKVLFKRDPSIVNTIDMIVIDEASHLRNRATQRWKVAYQFTKYAKRVVLLTGTPCPNEPTDVYALALLVNERRTRAMYRTFSTFKFMTMYKISKFKWVPREDAYTRAYDLLQPAIRYTKDSCLDLPPVMYEDRAVDLSSEQKKAIHDIKRHYQLAFDDINKITVAHAADCINKMRQAALGAIKVADNKYHILDYGPRFAVLCELIEEAPHKVVVVVPFKGIIQDLTARLGCAMLNGDVKIEERVRIIDQFNRPGGDKVLLIHPKVAAHGISLVAASTMVFYGPIFSVEESKQIVDRINRAGQRNQMTVIYMYGAPFEKRIYEKVKNKQLNESLFLELYKQEILEWAV